MSHYLDIWTPEPKLDFFGEASARTLSSTFNAFASAPDIL